MTKWKLRFSIVGISSAFDEFKAETDVGCKQYTNSTHVPLVYMSLLATHCTEEKQPEPINKFDNFACFFCISNYDCLPGYHQISASK